MLFDKDLRSLEVSNISEDPSTPSRQDLLSKVAAFKESLQESPDRIRHIELNTQTQHQSPLWYSARRFRLTASNFG